MEAYRNSYLPLIKPYRNLVETHSACKTLLDPKMSPAVLHRFLIEYCSRAVRMTEPVDKWITRAGQKTSSIDGLEELGVQLEKHAKHEAGHHLMLIEDAKKLASSWNTKGLGPKVDVESLFAAKPTKATEHYIKLHEDTIASDAPFGQVAIELEVEGLSVALGPKLIEACERVLGKDIMTSMTFLADHVEIDVGHTAFNEKLMNRLLEKRPESVEALANTGGDALKTYLDFFGECLELTEQALATSPA